MAVSSFSELLKTLRLRAHMSQRGLAEKMGVHRNTIWSWEQGNYLPDSKSMVLELARVLRLDESEARQLLEASLTAFSPYWSADSRKNRTDNQASGADCWSA
jgi:transcriptional regulator with XRE-family HTH domain